MSLKFPPLIPAIAPEANAPPKALAVVDDKPAKAAEPERAEAIPPVTAIEPMVKAAFLMLLFCQGSLYVYLPSEKVIVPVASLP